MVALCAASEEVTVSPEGIVASSGVGNEAVLDKSRPFRLGIGSCLNQYRQSPALEGVWEIAELDAFVFGGDNGYHDTPSCGIPWAERWCTWDEWRRESRRWLRAAVRRMTYGAQREDAMRRDDDYATLWTKHVGPMRSRLPRTSVLATWDDHDVGANDAGSDFPYLDASRRAFLDFWRRPILDLRESRDDQTVYAEYSFPSSGVQVLLLDTRSYRTPMQRNYGHLRKAWHFVKLAASRPSFCPRDDEFDQRSDGTMLGERQWLWLLEKLATPAALRIVVSSIQVLRPHDGSENWDYLPAERARLLDALRSTNQTVLVLSGDVHYGEIASLNNIVELTSSGLTEVWPCAHRNPHRLDNTLVTSSNFGLVHFRPPAALRLELRDHRGALAASHDLNLHHVDP